MLRRTIEETRTDLILCIVVVFLPFVRSDDEAEASKQLAESASATWSDAVINYLNLASIFAID